MKKKNNKHEMRTMTGMDWGGKVAVVRADLNVPLAATGGVADDARITAAAPTIAAIVAGGGGATVLSHLGRPREGASDPTLSLRPVADALAAVIKLPVRFCPSLSAAARASVGEVILLENTRFNVGEAENDTALARRYAALGDVFVMDAFASAHRAEASVAALATTGLPCCAGLLLQSELRALSRAVGDMQRPLVGIFGGAKISGKLAVIRRMAAMCDLLIVGGGIANTLLQARGDNIGASLTQPDMLETARELLQTGCLLLPQDAVVAPAVTAAEQVRQVELADMRDDEMILDIGEKTREECARALSGAKTIIWNGPLGLFERAAFADGTAALAAAVAASSAFSLIGGGDTIAAARRFGVMEKMSFVSTGGGALLEYLAGADLPGLAAFRC